MQKKLYKYTSMEYLRQALYYGPHASSLNQVNDPYEAVGIRYPERYRICCLTNSDLKMLLWAYYVNHRGCVIEYDMSNIINNDNDLIKKVDYEESLRTPHVEMSQEEVFFSLCRKSKEWDYENEYRAVYYQENANLECWAIDNGGEVYLKAIPTKVVFGLYAHLSENYYSSLRIIREYNDSLKDDSREGVSVEKCILDQNMYKLLRDRQFNYLLELENERDN